MAVRRAPKARELPPFPIKPPPEIPACAGCGAFQPQCLVPDGEGALAMCWLCAHAHVDHGCALDATAVHECECLPEAIFPERLIKERRARAGEPEAS